MEVRFFKTKADLRKWLEKNHDKVREQWIGFYKKSSGKPSITWPESVDEALCFGWIDGLRKSIDNEAYKIRFSPRRPDSVWSAVNIKRAKELVESGHMTSQGVAEFEKRDEDRARAYSYEQKNVELDKTFLATFKSNKKAWRFFESQPPWYRRVVSHWIMSAKQDATRRKRLSTLIADSEAGRRIRGVKQAK